MKRKKYKGSFTLEAAVVVPITMALIAGLLIFTLSVHDGVILKTVSTAIIMENASRFSKEPENIQGKILDMLSKRLIVTRNIAVDVTGGEDDCTATCRGSFQIASGFIRNLASVNYEIYLTLPRSKTMSDKHMSYQTFSGLFVVGRDILASHKAYHRFYERSVYL